MCKHRKNNTASESRSTLCIGGIIAILAAVIAVKVVVAVRLVRCFKMRGSCGVSTCDASENEAKEESMPINARYGQETGKGRFR